MNKPSRRKNNEIGKWVLYVNLTAVLCAVVLFMFLNLIENRVLGDRYFAKEYVEKNTEKEVALFQEYIDDNDIESDDFKAIDEWVFSKRNVLLILYEGNEVIYDSSMGLDRSIKSGRSQTGFSPPLYHPRYTLRFADKSLEADFMSFLDMRARFKYAVFQFAVCFVLILTIILINVFKMTNYYKVLEEDARKIEEGDLDHKITVKGKGRLSALAGAMERMRVSILERHEKENELIESSHKLVMSMSHDLRTPLTVLIGYLEILSGKKYKSDEARDIYIDKSKEKAYRIKQLSDKLFEYFLAFSTEEDVLHTEVYDKSVFSELVEDYVFTLNEKEYDIRYSTDEGKNYYIALDIQLMRRVMDNIFSNITKYADKSKPVSINVFNDGKQLVFSFGNYSKEDMEEAESTNIGLTVCEKIITRHKGTLDIIKEKDTFKVVVRLPISRTEKGLQ